MRNAPELALIHSRIRTMDPSRPFAESLSVKEGRFLSVGDSADILSECDRTTRVVEGRDFTVVPGLIDSHSHAVLMTSCIRGVDLSDCADATDAVNLLAAEAAETRSDGWVYGWNLPYEVFDKGIPSNQLLTRAVGERPALVLMNDIHGMIATSSALGQMGVTERMEFPDGSYIDVETGQVHELTATLDFAASRLPPLPHGAVEAQLERLFSDFNACGITSVHLMDDCGQPVETIRRLEESERLTLRVLIPVWARPGDDEDTRYAQLATRDESGKLWRRGIVKFFADAGIERGNAWLLEPDCFGENQVPAWRDRDEFYESVRQFVQQGFACVTHAVGDAAVADVLHAYRLARNGITRKHMNQITHVCTIPDDLVPRFAAEDVAASMQPQYYCSIRRSDDSDVFSRRLGDTRAARQDRCADLLTSGAVVSINSDWPTSPYDPREAMAYSRLRRRPKTDGPAFGESQGLTGLQALQCYTTMPARMTGEHEVLGRIAAGCQADFTAFGRDPVESEADELVDIPVMLTVVAGRVVHSVDLLE